jgi:hypothetical protein
LIAIFGRIREEQRKQEMNSNTSDIIADITRVPILQGKGSRPTFSTQYREKIFYIWYKKGKPSPRHLLPYITPEMEERGKVPSPTLLRNWIDKEFSARGKEMDAAVKRELDGRLIAEKVEMLSRHADLGLNMQNMAIDFLNENKDTLSAPAAVRLLVEGIRVERESRGVPASIDKVMNMSDEQLMKEVQKLITADGSVFEDLDADTG